MNHMVEKTLKQVGPQLAAIVLIVGAFLWHLERRETAVEQMAVRCHSVSEKMVEASHHLAEQFGANTEVLREVRTLLQRINGK